METESSAVGSLMPGVMKVQVTSSF
jgi:hypothetical protein